MKIKCYKCSNLATWQYMPGDANWYSCDNCVSRGCSCQLDFDTDEPLLDDKGRELVCCEYDFSEFGYDDDSEEQFYSELEKAGIDLYDNNAIDKYIMNGI